MPDSGGWFFDTVTLSNFALADDLAARRACAEMGIPVTGTIGILQAAIKDRNLSSSAANDMLCAMVTTGFRSPVKRLQT